MFSKFIVFDMKKIYLYCDPRSLNEATLYYNDIVRRGLEQAFGEMDLVVAHTLKEIKKPEYIYTITHHYFVMAKLRFPFAKTICWFQGIWYEEARLNRPRWKWPICKIEERFTVHNADYILFVSEQMREYYTQFFGYKGNNYTIMPCYNLHRSNSFGVEQYQKPTFAYAGGLSPWQSVDVLLDVYAFVEKSIPGAFLTLYCKSSPALQNMIDERGIKNYRILYVPLDSLQDEMHKHKYGFILREKNWVNLVATPTKMNSYLASYMIPIFSDGVNDFVRNINLGEYTLCANTPLVSQEIAEMIIRFENMQHDYNEYKAIVDKVFDKCYNDTKYIEILKNEIIRHFVDYSK